MLSALEITIYISTFLIFLLTFFYIVRVYVKTATKLSKSLFLDLTQTVVITYSFIIVKLLLDVVNNLDLISNKLYSPLSLVFTVLIFGSVVYSIKLIRNLAKYK